MRFIELVLISFLATAITAKAAQVQGVLVSETGSPISFKQLYLSNGSTASTSLTGGFIFTGLLKGSYELSTEINGQNVWLAAFTINHDTAQLVLPPVIVTKTIQLQEASVTAQINRGIERMPDIKDNVIYAGKKNEVVLLSTATANLAQNNTRQVFAKVPGIHVWENDGSGVQMGIASRGLSPNRMWEFNTRQNGYDISADPFGYPEAYYTPSVESLDRIEVIRGAASLQYGPQFGGVVNYIKKRSVSGKKVGVESMQTVGAYGMFSTFNAVGGNIGKFSYYANINYRRSDGWRQNNGYNTWNGFVNIGYQATKKMNISFEYTRMDQLVQQPGGLTDSMFAINAKQSLRNRNWFDLKWNIAATTLSYQFNLRHQLQVKAFVLTGDRSSIGYMNAINTADNIGIATGQYNKRTIDRDLYTNYGVEARHLFTYSLGKQKSHLAAGVRAYQGNTDRIQNSNGNRGTNFDMSAESDVLKRDLNFETKNIALFAENMFAINSRWSITPGMRFEHLQNTSAGLNDGRNLNQSSTRNFVLLGIGSQYSVTANTNIYANFSQAYRPVLFTDITPATTDSIDEQLRDANGYNIDLGYRGTVGNILSFDVSVFLMQYENRIGSYAVNGRNFRTNIGSSQSKGIESYIEFTPTALFKNLKVGQLSLFASMALMEATYTNWNNPDITKSLKGKKVENAPGYVHRFGLTYRYRKFSTTFQSSLVDEVYSDALNTRLPNAAATVGLIPSYQVADWSASYTFMKHYHVNAGINNLFDKAYFTRRAGGYPGPGLLPGDGRIWYVGIGVKL
jgi:Fe(3+) dicitrate transport protein